MTARSVTLLAVAALGCSAPIEPEKAPERVVTTVSEGGSTLLDAPSPRMSIGCTTENVDHAGRVTMVMREMLDEEGRVVVHALGSPDGTGAVTFGWVEKRAFDDLGRIAATTSGRLRFDYDADELHVSTGVDSTQSPLIDFRLNAQGLVEEVLASEESLGPYILQWQDDVRPLELSWTNGARSRWSWNAAGFLLERTLIGKHGSCTRRVSWDERERTVSYVVSDAAGVTRDSGLYAFDEEGRMIRELASHSAERTWVHRDGWSIEDSTGGIFRASAACHYPPTRKELARALAASWQAPFEKRPDHLHTLYDVQGPITDCIVGAPGE